MWCLHWNWNASQTSNFTVISTEILALSAPYGTCGLNTFSLNTYSNQAVRIGIRYVGADQYFFMVDDFKVTSSNLAVNDVLASKFSTFPNPVKDLLTLTNGDGVQILAIKITDLNGRVVKTLNYPDAMSEMQVNVADLSAGMYLMNISSELGTATKKNR